MANIVDIIIKGTDKSKKAITAPIKNLKDLKTAAASLGPAFKLGAIAAVVGLGLLTAQAIKTQEETQKMAQILGVSTEALSTLTFASKIAGTDVEVLRKSMQRLSVQVLDAGRGLKEAKDNFAELGIEVKNADGTLKDTEALFKEAADAIAGLEDGLQKTALAQKLFGKSGAQLIPLLNEGSAGIEKMQQKARSLGLEITDNTAEAAAELIDNITILQEAFAGAFNVISAELLPGLVALTGEFTGSKEGAIEAASAVTTFVEAISFLGRVGISVVSALKALFEGLGSAIATQAAAIFQLMQGNFSGFQQTIADGFTDLTEILEQSANTINQTWDDSNKKRVESSKKSNDKIVNDVRVKTAEELKIEKKLSDDKKKLERDVASAKVSTQQFAFSSVKNLANDNAKAQKVLAVGQTIVQGVLAVQTALTVPPPLGFVLAGVVGALAAANVAKVAATPVGFQDGGVVGGNSFSGDKILAGLNSAEVVLTAANTDNLAGQLAGDSKMTQFIAEIDGRVLLDFIGDASRDGRLILSQDAIV